MRVATVPIHEIELDPANVRTHDERNIKAIADSLATFGQRKPIVAMKADAGYVVIAGNGTLEAAKMLGWTEIALTVVPEDWTSDAAAAYAIADNRTAELADWDKVALDMQLHELDLAGWDLETLGFDSPGKTADDVEEDEVPEVPEDPITQPGDLWILGEHRVLCGDSTKPDDVERLMDGHESALILADPPYFGKVEAEWDNDFDGYAGFLDFLASVFALWAPTMMDRGTSGWWCSADYAWHTEGLLRKHFAVFNHIVWYKGQGLGATVSVAEMRRWRPRSERLILCEKQHSPDALLASFNAKTAHIAARLSYSNIIERMVAWRESSGLSVKEIDAALGTNGMAGHYFGRSQWSLPTRDAWDIMRPLFASRGVDIGEFDAQRKEFDAQRKEFDAQRREFDAQRREFDAQRREFDAQPSSGATDVWEASAPSGDDRNGHPTPKPVSIISKIVSAHSRTADLVTDPFLGSGTTLIAAEQLGRVCYGMELDPGYCDVIVKRWENLTGGTATREGA